MIEQTKEIGDDVAVDLGEWISTGIITALQELPPYETPVLILFYSGKVRIGEIRWERGGWEATYEDFQYWDDPNNEGQDWEWSDVIGWLPLPETYIKA